MEDVCLGRKHFNCNTDDQNGFQCLGFLCLGVKHVAK